MTKLSVPHDLPASNPSDPRVYIKTFGCLMNEYDSEKILAMLAPVYSAAQSLFEADLIVINTCSVREKAAHKLYSLLGALRTLKERRPDLVIGVAGCVAQQEGLALIKRESAVDFVVGTHNLSLVPKLVELVREGRGPQIAIDYRDEWEDLPAEFDALPRNDYGVMSNFSSPARALIAIQRGCDKNCAFCVVPNTRGPEVSRPVDEIIREIRAKVRAGAREVVLLGQTVNSYGRDLAPRRNFEELVQRTAELEGVRRIRFTSPHPQEVRPGFIALFENVPQLCPHIHLPLQSGSDRILKLMNRNYRLDRYAEIVEAVRSARSDAAVTTDLIVGFPTETEDDFGETLDAVRRFRFNYSFSFVYSRRPKTAAAENFREEVPGAIAKERLKRLQDLQEQISEEINAATIGHHVAVQSPQSQRSISGEAVRGSSSAHPRSRKRPHADVPSIHLPLRVKRFGPGRPPVYKLD